MTIPSFDDGYHLPSGEHTTTWNEAEKVFGTTNDRRRQVWADFMALVQRYERLSLRFETVLIDGSFVTGREEPGDVDGAAILPPETLRKAMDSLEKEDRRSAALLADSRQSGNLIRVLFGAHLFVVPDQRSLDMWSRFSRLGEPGDGLRDPDPHRDPEWLTKPVEKGILKINEPLGER